MIVLIVFLLVCLLAMTVLMLRLFVCKNKELRQMQDILMQTMECKAKENTQHLAAQAAELRHDFYAVTSELNQTQSTHLANFLSLVNTATQQQSQQGAQLQESLMNRLQEQSQVQDRRLLGLSTGMETALQGIRTTLTSELAGIRENNDRALAKMRETVEEKLQQTLNDRISSSFKTVEEQLLAVHRGLGEMREIAQNVDGLRRVLTNVKTRGTFGEIQLGMILQEILTPDQYACNIATRPKSNERVEFAVRLPGHDAHSTVWLPIDAKFPMEDYVRLIDASDACDAQAQASSAKALENRILSEAAKIHSKYVEAPYTTEFAILYLPVESLWAEVLKRPGLIERVQRECHVTIAGPTVLAALLNSLQMGFRTLAIERKSAEVWRLLGVVKGEFAKFSDAIGGVEKKVESIRNALDAVRTRTNVMSRHLKSVDVVELATMGEDVGDGKNRDGVHADRSPLSLP